MRTSSLNLLAAATATFAAALLLPGVAHATWFQVTVSGTPTVDYNPTLQSWGFHFQNVSGGGNVLWVLAYDPISPQDLPWWLDGTGWHNTGSQNLFDLIYVPANSADPWALDCVAGTPPCGLYHWNGSSWTGGSTPWHSLGVIASSTNTVVANGAYNGSNCSTSSPAGSCIWFSTDGVNWTQESNGGGAAHAGALQVTTDGLLNPTNPIYAVDSSNNVWHRLLSRFGTIIWSEMSTSICGGGTFSSGGIAVYNGAVYSIQYESCGASSPCPGNVYLYNSSSSCWSLLSGTNNQMVSIGFDNTAGLLYGVHGGGGTDNGTLWKWQ